jgi:hypothetical protein
VLQLLLLLLVDFVIVDLMVMLDNMGVIEIAVILVIFMKFMKQMN